MEEQEKPKSTLTFLGKAWVEYVAAFFLGLGLIGFGIGGYALYVNGPIDPNAKFDLSVLSDFGGLIAGFSGLFTLGSVLLFYRALGLQREDIKANLEEQGLTREVFLQQSKTQKLQQFESTFSLVQKNLNSEKESLRKIFLSEQEFDSRSRKSDFWAYTSYAILQIKTKFKPVHNKYDLEENIDSSKEEYLREANPIIKFATISGLEYVTVYLSLLELIIDLINTAPDENKNLYLKIVKSGMSKKEIQWLYFYATFCLQSSDPIRIEPIKKLIEAGVFKSKYLNDHPFKVLNYYLKQEFSITSPQTNQ